MPFPCVGCAACTFSHNCKSHAVLTCTLLPCTTILQVPSLLSPTFRAMVRFVSHPALPVHGVDNKLLNVYEGCLEVGRSDLAYCGLEVGGEGGGCGVGMSRGGCVL